MIFTRGGEDRGMEMQGVGKRVRDVSWKGDGIVVGRMKTWGSRQAVNSWLDKIGFAYTGVD
jgi:hypothetical protein